MFGIDAKMRLQWYKEECKAYIGRELSYTDIRKTKVGDGIRKAVKIVSMFLERRCCVMRANPSP